MDFVLKHSVQSLETKFKLTVKRKASYHQSASIKNKCT